MATDSGLHLAAYKSLFITTGHTFLLSVITFWRFHDRSWTGHNKRYNALFSNPFIVLARRFWGTGRIPSPAHFPAGGRLWHSPCTLSETSPPVRMEVTGFEIDALASAIPTLFEELFDGSAQLHGGFRYRGRLFFCRHE